MDKFVMTIYTNEKTIIQEQCIQRVFINKKPVTKKYISFYFFYNLICF